MKHDEWFKNLQNTCNIWVDPEKERKDNKNATIVGWGIGLGGAIWICAYLVGVGVYGFLLFMLFLFGSYMLTED